MFRLLIIGGAVMTVLGIVLIPLPGPGYPLLIVGVIALLAAAVLRMPSRQAPRRTS